MLPKVSDCRKWHFDTVKLKTKDLNTNVLIFSQYIAFQNNVN